VLRNILARKQSLDDAVDAARIHHGFAPDSVRIEQRRPPPRAALNGLRAMGHVIDSSRGSMGDANSILLDSQGKLWGYADPREGGLATAPKKLTKSP